MDNMLKDILLTNYNTSYNITYNILKPEENVLTLIIKPTEISKMITLINLVKDVFINNVTVKIDKNGVKIYEGTDTTQKPTISISLKVFEHYDCNKETITIDNVNMSYLLELVKYNAPGKDISLIIYINKNNFHDGKALFKDIQCYKFQKYNFI